jgi:hypothetical protein
MSEDLFGTCSLSFLFRDIRDIRVCIFILFFFAFFAPLREAYEC